MLLLGMLAVLAAAHPVQAGAPCPSTYQLWCGRTCEAEFARTMRLCNAYQSAGASEACELEADSTLQDCYERCAVSGGCAAV